MKPENTARKTTRKEPAPGTACSRVPFAQKAQNRHIYRDRERKVAKG